MKKETNWIRVGVEVTLGAMVAYVSVMLIAIGVGIILKTVF